MFIGRGHFLIISDTNASTMASAVVFQSTHPPTAAREEQ